MLAKVVYRLISGKGVQDHRFGDQSIREQSIGNFYATVPLALHLTLWIKTHTSLTNNPQNLSS